MTASQPTEYNRRPPIPPEMTPALGWTPRHVFRWIDKLGVSELDENGDMYLLQYIHALRTNMLNDPEALRSTLPIYDAKTREQDIREFLEANPPDAPRQGEAPILDTSIESASTMWVKPKPTAPKTLRNLYVVTNVVIPIPKAIFSDASFDLAHEISPQITEAVAGQYRLYQLRHFFNMIAGA